MHRHNNITYYTQSTVCQSGFYERIFLSSSPWAYAGFAKGGQLFWRLGELRLATCGGAKCLLMGSGACSPKKLFLNGASLCVLEHIFINYLLLKKSKMINGSHVTARWF